MVQENKIPKIIHMTWFSGDPYPPSLIKCMDTWKKVLPDFEVKLWNMEMARALDIPYVNEALDAKKWAFAGDVVRAYAVWRDGGVYMDTDIWVLKRFDDFLKYPMVFFMETNDYTWNSGYNPDGCLDIEGHCLMPNHYVKGRQIQAAMFMGEKGHWASKKIVDYYKSQHFFKDDGTPNIEVISPSRYAKVLEENGFVYVDKDQVLDDVRVFNSSYIALSKSEVKKNSLAIHMAAHAWNKRTILQEIKYRVRQSIFFKVLSPLNKVRYKK